jgi:tetratricopeptide (TPR) repeat protein
MPEPVPAVQRGSVSGQVLLPSGQQPNVRIKVTLSGYRVAATVVYTDNKGRFSIPGISDGTYNLEVQAESGTYVTVNQEVRVIYGAHPMLVITLRERGAPKQPSAGVVSTAELDAGVPDTARKEYEKGAQYSDKGRFEDAIDHFKKAIAISPNYLMAHNNLGVQYLKLGKWAEAATAFEKAVAIDGKALNPRQNLGIALIEQKQYQEAIEHLNEAIAIDSSSAVSHLYLGIASLGINDIEQAERELSTTLSLDGTKYPNAHFYLGLVYMRKGEREPAIRQLKAYVEQSPKGEKVPRARELLEKLKH